MMMMMKAIWETAKEITLQRIQLRSAALLIPNQLDGLCVIVTGSTNGIGYHTARELAFAAAHVIMACQRVDGAKKIAERWKEDTGDVKTLHVEVMELDLLSLSSVRQFTAKWDQSGKPLHILINNAGILLLGGNLWRMDSRSIFKLITSAPCCSPFFCSHSMLKANSASIVNVNSTGHHWGAVEPKSWKIGAKEERKFSSSMSYGSSKLAQAKFPPQHIFKHAAHVSKGLGAKLISKAKISVLCVAAHPGIVESNLRWLFDAFSRLSNGRMRGFWMLDPSEGARNSLFCSVGADVPFNTTENFAYYSQCTHGRMSSLADDTKKCSRVWDETLHFLGFSPNGCLSEIYLPQQKSEYCIKNRPVFNAHP
ncbi:hypothetical protein ACJRO7_002067 [Eucalyptus globulus]|uniref:Uncharacterized protein n=1 Tax=Eucalyptus globulus TaxID=34317 RepID=A0ABD3LWN5_EUCGL